MRRVTVESLVDETHIDTAASAPGLKLVRENGQAFVLPLRGLGEHEFAMLLQFFFADDEQPVQSVYDEPAIPYQEPVDAQSEYLPYHVPEPQHPQPAVPNEVPYDGGISLDDTSWRQRGPAGPPIEEDDGPPVILRPGQPYVVGQQPGAPQRQQVPRRAANPHDDSGVGSI